MKLAKVLPEILINWLKHWSNHAEYYKLTEVFFIEFEHVPQRKTHLFKIVAFQAASVFFFYSHNITITIQHYMDINEADTGSRKHTMALWYSSLNLQILMYNKAYIDYKIFYRVFLS